MEPIQQLEAWCKQLEDHPHADLANMDVAKRLLKHGIEAAHELQRLRETLQAKAQAEVRAQHSDFPGKPVDSDAPAARLAPPAASSEPALKLGDINARLAPLSISVAGLAEFGIEALARDKNAHLFSEAQFRDLLDRLSVHLNQIAKEQ